MATKEYPLPWDVFAKTVTLLVIAIDLALLAAFTVIYVEGLLQPEVYAIIAALLLGVLLLPLLFAPLKYRLEDDALVIKRILRSIRIPYTSITSIETADSLDGWGKLGAFRLWASGGLYGYYGAFYSSKLGVINVYARRRQGFVLITLKNGTKYALAPPDPKEFERELARTIILFAGKAARSTGSQ